MEVERFVGALEETIWYLRKSHASAWSNMSIEEMIRRLEAEATKAKGMKPVDVILLDRLFAPTGVIQEISIENEWGTSFLRISQVIDAFTSGRE